MYQQLLSQKLSNESQQCIQNCNIKNCKICGYINICEECQQNYKLNEEKQCELQCEYNEDECYQINLKQQENSQIATNVAGGIVGFVTYGLFIFTPIQIIFSLFDFLQTINLLTYVKVNYPTSLYTFVKLFSFSNFEFLPSIKSDNAQVPQTFGRERFDSNFYSNLIQPLIVWVTAFFIYFISYLVNISKINKSSRIFKIFNFIYEKFFYQIFIGLVFLTFYKINLSVQLQIYGKRFDLIGTIYLIISLLIFISQTIFVIFGLEIIKNNNFNNLSQLTLIQRLKNKFQQFSTKQFVYRYHFFNGLVLLRKIFFVSTLVFLQDDKITQIILIQGIFSLQTLLLLINKPYPYKKQNNIVILCNFYYLLSVLCINGLAYDDITNIFSNQLREFFAAVAILFLSLLFLSYLFYIFQIIKGLSSSLLPDKVKMLNSR
ncbi:transmembrane protein, putative (macronuclear) [Tetrahymena thermophila SB210]|uniref:Transmembrane protein, putative n=1 Tax=Tetrahymena thermophila (strain SB210) TaxID=312017 RepID=W7X7H2_TETTS|nr:transmembrane protein, putative [Tetrahymena thermophila SB210]EWS75320.1 transmembrane protein, putative [Tetrahymena thermophila SB210]|eukprot:XP_012652152.1 transmembrane protein, putative [Tetrahymena thermophila SB210]